jgi:hypothetical protein
VGGTVNRVRLRADVPDGFDGVYLFGSLADFLAASPDEFRQAFGSARVDFPVTSFGGFVQDHWSVARELTLDLGVRYDFERLPAGFNQDTNNVSLRIGLAWSPSPKWVLRAGYGIFFDRYVLANLTRAVEKNGVQAFEQVVDGSSAVSLFALTQGGPCLFQPRECRHRSSGLIRAWRRLIAIKRAPVRNTCLQRISRSGPIICSFMASNCLERST